MPAGKANRRVGEVVLNSESRGRGPIIDDFTLFKHIQLRAFPGLA